MRRAPAPRSARCRPAPSPTGSARRRARGSRGGSRPRRPRRRTAGRAPPGRPARSAAGPARPVPRPRPRRARPGRRGRSGPRRWTAASRPRRWASGSRPRRSSWPGVGLSSGGGSARGGSRVGLPATRALTVEITAGSTSQVRSWLPAAAPISTTERNRPPVASDEAHRSGRSMRPSGVVEHACAQLQHQRGRHRLLVAHERDEGPRLAVVEVVAALGVGAERVHAEPVHPLGRRQQPARDPQGVRRHGARREVTDLVGDRELALADHQVGGHLRGGVELGDGGDRQPAPWAAPGRG